jgi:hypothetical protein
VTVHTKRFLKSSEDTTGENLRELVTDIQSGYRFANKMDCARGKRL